MARVDIRAWALKGAELRLTEIAQEARAIFAEFPELRGPGREFETQLARTGMAVDGETRKSPSVSAGRRRRRKMSAAARRAVSARMKKYWAERRKAKQ